LAKKIFKYSYVVCPAKRVHILANKCNKLNNDNGPKKEFCIFMTNLFSCPATTGSIKKIFYT